MLYIVSTPIGNLKDITLRALETLKQVELIAAEDTRHTGHLLKHYNITTPLTSYFEHNKFQKARRLLEALKDGRDIALVTDAGTPGISDPGYHLIRLAAENGVPLTVVPGPSAVTAALPLSGLPPDRFLFIGFLPVKSAARQKRLAECKGLKATVIFYESPHRLVKTLRDMEEVLGDCETVCAREITKMHEEVRRGTPRELGEYFMRHQPRGEFAVLFHAQAAG